MFDKLQKQYKNLIVTDVTTFDINQYYYFRNEYDQLFGIRKTIHNNEYELLRMLYVEKTFYYDDALHQSMYEYLYESGEYPFKAQNFKCLIITERGAKSLSKTTYDEIYNLLKDIFGEIAVLDLKGSKAIFYFTSFDVGIEELFLTISGDFLLNLSVHEGIVFHQKDRNFPQYLELVLASLKDKESNYSNIVHLVNRVNASGNQKGMLFLKRAVLKELDGDPVFEQLIEEFFNCNLNIAQTSKNLYVHRNTLLNKLETIKKTTGIDVQNFKQASTLHLLFHYKP